MAAGAAEIQSVGTGAETAPSLAGGVSASKSPATNTPEVSAPLRGEVLPPVLAGTDPTRTALKRAMRARAQEHAEAAIAVLVVNLASKDPRIATAAANDLLAWGFGKPATEIEAGEGTQMIVIRRFGEDV